MAKPKRRKGTPSPARGDSHEPIHFPTPAPVPPAGASGVPWTSGALALAALLAFAWGLLCWRASQHYRAGGEAVRQGRPLEAAREFESAVGFYAPLNPYARAAAEQMRTLASKLGKEDPPLSREIFDRLRRSVRSARWLVQPYPDLLLEPAKGTLDAPASDPSAPLFFGSVAGLLLGLGIWWAPLRAAPKSLLGTAGLLLWAMLLYLC